MRIRGNRQDINSCNPSLQRCLREDFILLIRIFLSRSLFFLKREMKLYFVFMFWVVVMELLSLWHKDDWLNELREVLDTRNVVTPLALQQKVSLCYLWCCPLLCITHQHQIWASTGPNPVWLPDLVVNYGGGPVFQGHFGLAQVLFEPRLNYTRVFRPILVIHHKSRNLPGKG